MAKNERFLAIWSGNGKIFLIENSELWKCFDCCEIEFNHDCLLKNKNSQSSSYLVFYGKIK
jgi:hypothetical protein